MRRAAARFAAGAASASAHSLAALAVLLLALALLPARAEYATTSLGFGNRTGLTQTFGTALSVDSLPPSRLVYLAMNTTSGSYVATFDTFLVDLGTEALLPDAVRSPRVLRVLDNSTLAIISTPPDKEGAVMFAVCTSTLTVCGASIDLPWITDPNGMVVSDGLLFVTDGTNSSVSMFTYTTGTSASFALVSRTPLSPAPRGLSRSYGLNRAIVMQGHMLSVLNLTSGEIMRNGSIGTGEIATAVLYSVNGGQSTEYLYIGTVSGKVISMFETSMLRNDTWVLPYGGNTAIRTATTFPLFASGQTTFVFATAGYVFHITPASFPPTSTPSTYSFSGVTNIALGVISGATVLSTLTFNPIFVSNSVPPVVLKYTGGAGLTVAVVSGPRNAIAGFQYNNNLYVLSNSPQSLVFNEFIRVNPNNVSDVTRTTVSNSLSTSAYAAYASGPNVGIIVSFQSTGIVSKVNVGQMSLVEQFTMSSGFGAPVAATLAANGTVLYVLAGTSAVNVLQFFVGNATETMLQQNALSLSLSGGASAMTIDPLELFLYVAVNDDAATLLRIVAANLTLTSSTALRTATASGVTGVHALTHDATNYIWSGLRDATGLRMVRVDTTTLVRDASFFVGTATNQTFGTGMTVQGSFIYGSLYSSVDGVASSLAIANLQGGLPRASGVILTTQRSATELVTGKFQTLVVDSSSSRVSYIDRSSATTLISLPFLDATMPLLTTVTGSALSTHDAGTIVTLDVTTFTATSVRQLVGGDAVDVFVSQTTCTSTVSCAADAFLAAAPATIDLGNGSYVTALQIVQAGTYSIAVGVNGVNLTSSPYTVNVLQADAGVYIVAPSSPTTSQSGTSFTFTARLRRAPSAAVTVTLSPSVTGIASISPATLTFNSSNWFSALTVTVTGQRLLSQTTDTTYSITGTSSSTDANYASLSFTAVSSVTSTYQGDWPTLTSVSPDFAASSANPSPTAITVTLLGTQFNTSGVLYIGSLAVSSSAILSRNTTHIVFQPATQTQGYYTVRFVNPSGTYAELADAMWFSNGCLEEGKYGDRFTCATCPTQATCPGGDRIWPATGYWNTLRNSSTMYSCLPAARCVGGRSASCAAGYTGDYCGQCATDYYGMSNVCLQCPSPTITIVKLVALILMNVLFVVTVLFASFITSTILFNVMFISEIVFVVSIVGAFYHTEIFNVGSSLMSLLALQIEFFAPGCLVSSANTFFSQWIATLVSMGVSVAIAALIFGFSWCNGLLRLFRHTKHALKAPKGTVPEFNPFPPLRLRAQRLFLMLVALHFAPILVASVRSMVCVSNVASGASASRVLAYDPQQTCFVGAHLGYGLASVALICAFGLGFPVILLTTIKRIRYKLYEDDVNSKFGWVYLIAKGRFVLAMFGILVLILAAVGAVGAGLILQPIITTGIQGGLLIVFFMLFLVRQPIMLKPVLAVLQFALIAGAAVSVANMLAASGSGVTVSDTLRMAFSMIGGIAMIILFAMVLVTWIGTLTQCRKTRIEDYLKKNRGGERRVSLDSQDQRFYTNDDDAETGEPLGRPEFFGAARHRMKRQANAQKRAAERTVELDLELDDMQPAPAPRRSGDGHPRRGSRNSGEAEQQEPPQRRNSKQHNQRRGSDTHTRSAVKAAAAASPQSPSSSVLLGPPAGANDEPISRDEMTEVTDSHAPLRRERNQRRDSDTSSSSIDSPRFVDDRDAPPRPPARERRESLGASFTMGAGDHVDLGLDLPELSGPGLDFAPVLPDDLPALPAIAEPTLGSGDVALEFDVDLDDLPRASSDRPPARKPDQR